jgi:asparagine synthase (glutamine-hydrolysing)
MCGIYLNSRIISTHELKFKLNLLKDRGPDYQGILIKNGLTFGHTRLSIIDLEERSNQPMEIEDYIIVFNGEIYNYEEIKSELIKKGIEFTTQSDTEVLLRGYMLWNEKILDKFNGMFSFVIYDKTNHQLFAARDRLGVKPFYYSWDGKHIEICSMVKPLSENKKLDYEAIEIYLQTGYIPSPWSIYKEVKKLSPGHYLKLDLTNKKLEFHKYWDLEKVKITNKGYIQSKDELKTLLKDAVKIRLRSDVPTACFLSGGIDSALVSSISKEIIGDNLKTFTIGFEEKEFDESRLSKKFAKIIGAKHEEKICTPKDLINLMPKFFEAYDEPFADSSAIPSLLLNKSVKSFATVALSGDGGDESFLGYNHFNWLKKADFIFYVPYFLRKILSYLFPFKIFGKRAEAIRLILRYKKMNDFIAGIFTGFGPLLLKNKSTTWINKYNSYKKLSDHKIQKTADLNIKLWLENDSNVKVDRASMAFSVEVRSPFLDYRIVEFARSLPVDFRFEKGRQKKILRDILNEYIPETVFNVPKKGFSIPIGKWFRNELKSDLIKSLGDDFFNEFSMIDKSRVKKFLKYHLSGKRDYSTYLWRLYVLSKWKILNEEN